MIAQPSARQSSLQKKVIVPSQHYSDILISTTVTFSSALYKPSKKHKQGTHTYTYSLSLTKQHELFLPDLNFRGAYLDHPSWHSFLCKKWVHPILLLLGGLFEWYKEGRKVVWLSYSWIDLTPVGSKSTISTFSLMYVSTHGYIPCTWFDVKSWFFSFYCFTLPCIKRCIYYAKMTSWVLNNVLRY